MECSFCSEMNNKEENNFFDNCAKIEDISDCIAGLDIDKSQRFIQCSNSENSLQDKSHIDLMQLLLYGQFSISYL